MRQHIRFIASLATACLAMVQFQASADQVINDDLIVSGSICVGFDCANGEVFGYDTIRLKENNVRIKFQDTSASSSFPSGDWEITANDSSNGGANYLAIADVTSGTVPFKISQGNKTNAFFMAQSTGYIGIGTATPGVHVEIKSGNSPAIRLNQDNTGGFAAQSWDIAGNETNFFIRDITNAGKLPLRITAGAPSGAIFVASDGDVGFETITPDGLFDIAHPVDANNHAVLVSPTANFGINIDNGFNPRFLFDVQTTNGTSRFSVGSDGKVGVGLGTAGTAGGLFDVQVSGVSKLLVESDGDIGLGGVPLGRFELKNTAGNQSYLAVDASGRLIVGGNVTNSYYGGAFPNFELQGGTGLPALMGIATQNEQKVGSIMFKAGGNDKWSLSSRNNFDSASGATVDRFAFVNGSGVEVLTLHQSGSLFLGDSAGANNNTTHTIQAASGAFLTTGGVWTNASSRSYKQDIKQIDLSEAEAALDALEPVTYRYKSSPNELYAGFIAEDVPEIVSTNDRKGLSSMDIVAVLTKVLQQQHTLVKEQQGVIEKLNLRLKSLEDKE